MGRYVVGDDIFGCLCVPLFLGVGDDNCCCCSCKAFTISVIKVSLLLLSPFSLSVGGGVLVDSFSAMCVPVGCL